MADDPIAPEEGAQPEAAYDPNDPKQVRERRKNAKLREKRRQEFLARMLVDPGGRDWLYGVLNELCHVWDPRFGVAPSGHEQQSATFFHLGQREVGLQILRTLLRDHPNLTATMISEHAT